jgi:hypothetical protein
MPKQDASGRWISDDGMTYWDGTAWRPIAQPIQPGMVPPGAYYPQAQPSRSPWKGILIGCGLALVLLIVLGVTCTVLMASNPDFQRGFCNSYTANDSNLTCPFNPPPASP